MHLSKLETAIIGPKMLSCIKYTADLDSRAVCEEGLRALGVIE